MNAVIVAGICIEHDAISAAVCDQAELLDGIEGIESVTVIAQFIDRPIPVPSEVVLNPWELLIHPAIAAADVVIFHWGIHFALFDVLAVLPATVQRIVHFHNFTPPHLADPAARPNLERSREQAELLNLPGVRVWTESPYNLETLRSLGVQPDDMVFMPFPIEQPARQRPREVGAVVNVLTVGRLVHAKGVHVLIDALERLSEGTRVRCTIIGSRDSADLDYCTSLQRRVREGPLREIVDIQLDVDDAGLWEAYRQADVVVSPSFHEGLCVPIIEGYRAGCRAIVTDSGNLPYIVVEPDPIVPAGDADALSRAIQGVVAELCGTTPEPRDAVETLVAQYESPAIRTVLEAEVTRLRGRSVA